MPSSYNCRAAVDFNAAQWFGSNNVLCRGCHDSADPCRAPKREGSNVIQFPGP